MILLAVLMLVRRSLLQWCTCYTQAENAPGEVCGMPTTSTTDDAAASSTDGATDGNSTVATSAAMAPSMHVILNVAGACMMALLATA